MNAWNRNANVTFTLTNHKDDADVGSRGWRQGRRVLVLCRDADQDDTEGRSHDEPGSLHHEDGGFASFSVWSATKPVIRSGLYTST